MKYTEFTKALKHQDWAAFAGVHFIIPPSLCEDISYVQTPFYHTLDVQTICRSPKYGLEKFGKRQELYNCLDKLEEHVRLIPSSMEMHCHARKTPVIHTLDRIAKDITSTARPTTYLHLHPCRTLASYRDDHVIKRTHSAGFRHVILPGGSAPIEDTGTEFSDEASWFIQQVIPLLKQFECRVGICLQDPEKKVIFRKWTGRDSTVGPDEGTVWQYGDVGSLIDIGTLQ
jgi:hypothetical protein